MLLKKYSRILLIFLFIYFTFLYLIKNLGYFFDITSQPVKSDIILCLGGETNSRMKKGIELFNKNFSTKNLILFTEKNAVYNDIKLNYLIKNGLKKENIFFNSETYNTYDELEFVKKYMIQNNYKSVIIISSEPHSKRIKMLIESFLKFSDNDISYTIVGQDSSWWDKDKYYNNKNAIFHIKKESLKIIYNYIYYKLDQIFKFNDDSKDKLIKYKQIVFDFIF